MANRCHGKGRGHPCKGGGVGSKMSAARIRMIAHYGNRFGSTPGQRATYNRLKKAGVIK